MKNLVILIAIILFILLVLASLKQPKSIRIQSEKDNEEGTLPEDPNQVRRDNNILPGENYISPVKFQVGLMHPKKFKAMNNCIPDVLYPINAIDVDYGSKVPADCPCTQFIQAP